MPIAISQMRALVTLADDALLVEELEALEYTLKLYEINNVCRVRMFLAQILHESGGLRYTQEIWGPTPAQRRYEFNEKLGNTIKDDGYLYRGRGYIQLTGRFNYYKASKALEHNFLLNPDRVADLPWRWIVSGWFWATHDCNEIADAGTDIAFKKITKIINGGYTHLEQRRRRYAKCCAVIKTV